MPKPLSVIQAVFAIWGTLALDFFVTIFESLAGAMTSDQLVGNFVSLVLFGLLSLKIFNGKNWACHVYAVLIAVEVAALCAFGMDDATGLESFVSFVSIPIEGWVLFMLFRSDSAQWFGERTTSASDGQ